TMNGIIRAIAAAGVLGLTSCGTVSDAWQAGQSAEAAEDQIMLVRGEPASFGHKRLMRQASSYPDLSVFLGQRGFPDFLAETSNSDRHYLILYYLDRKHAFAARTRGGRAQTIEFAGPYPITEREVSLLSRFKSDAALRRAELAAARE